MDGLELKKKDRQKSEKRQALQQREKLPGQGDDFLFLRFFVLFLEAPTNSTTYQNGVTASYFSFFFLDGF